MARTGTPTAPAPSPPHSAPRGLVRLRRVGYLLDSALPIPGTRFRIGLDGLIGLIPGIGDLAGGMLALYILVESARLGAPGSLLARMGWNVAVDTLVGEIPILGDVFDIGWRANLRNLDLLEEHLRRPAEVRRSSRWLALLAGLAAVLMTVGAIALALTLFHLLSGLIR